MTFGNLLFSSLFFETGYVAQTVSLNSDYRVWHSCEQQRQSVHAEMKGSFQEPGSPSSMVFGGADSGCRHGRQMFLRSHLASPCIWVLTDLKRASCLILPSVWDDRGTPPPCPSGASNFVPCSGHQAPGPFFCLLFIWLVFEQLTFFIPSSSCVSQRASPAYLRGSTSGG